MNPSDHADRTAFIDKLSVILGTESGELHAATVRYLRITIITVPFMLVSNVLYNQLRLAGSAKDSMLGLLVERFTKNSAVAELAVQMIKLFIIFPGASAIAAWICITLK